MSSKTFLIDPRLDKAYSTDGRREGLDLISSPTFQRSFINIFNQLNFKLNLCTVTAISPTQLNLKFNRGHAQEKIIIVINLVFLLVSKFNSDPVKAWEYGPMNIATQIDCLMLDINLTLAVVQETLKVLLNDLGSYLHESLPKRLSESKERLDKTETVLTQALQTAQRDWYLKLTKSKYPAEVTVLLARIAEAKKEYAEINQTLLVLIQAYANFLALNSIEGLEVADFVSLHQRQKEMSDLISDLSLHRVWDIQTDAIPLVKKINPALLYNLL